MTPTDGERKRLPSRDDPQAVIREELGEYREAVEALAEMDLGVLSEDARTILEILDQEESE